MLHDWKDFPASDRQVPSLLLMHNAYLASLGMLPAVYSLFCVFSPICLRFSVYLTPQLFLIFQTQIVYRDIMSFSDPDSLCCTADFLSALCPADDELYRTCQIF